MDNDGNSLSFGCDGELCWRGAAGRRLHLLQAQQQQLLLGHDDSFKYTQPAAKFFIRVSLTVT